MQYCIFGANGQVGERLCQRLRGKYFSHSTCDITDIDQVREAVREVDWVINAAAFTDVDGAEGDKKAAKQANDYGVKVIAQVCAERRVPLCHFSTDFIFSGYYRREHDVGDEPRPVNYYGETKLKGERHVRKLPRHLLIRTSWVYGGQTSFLNTMLKKSKEESVYVAADQFSRPTYAKDLAAATEVLIESGTVGTVHVSNQGWCSRAEWVEELYRMVHSPTKVQWVASSHFHTPAQRPKFSVLKVTNFPFLPNRHWKYAMAEHLRELGYFVE